MKNNRIVLISLLYVALLMGCTMTVTPPVIVTGIDSIRPSECYGGRVYRIHGIDAATLHWTIETNHRYSISDTLISY